VAASQAFWIDQDFDREQATDGISRYRAEVRGRASEFAESWGDISPVTFAATAWRLATALRPGGIAAGTACRRRHSPRAQRLDLSYGSATRGGPPGRFVMPLALKCGQPCRPHTAEVVAAARAAGATIMHSPITFAAGYNELSAHPHPDQLLRGVHDAHRPRKRLPGDHADRLSSASPPRGEMRQG